MSKTFVGLALAVVTFASIALPLALVAAPAAPSVPSAPSIPSAPKGCDIIGVYAEMEWVDADGVYHYDFEAECAAKGAVRAE